MEILAWNTDKQRMTTMDVEFTKENTTWFDRCTKGSEIHKITDVDGGLLISKAGYEYPVWIGGKSRAHIEYSRKIARELVRLYTPS
jgi:prophage tail gpP-like protein